MLEKNQGDCANWHFSSEIDSGVRPGNKYSYE